MAAPALRISGLTVHYGKRVAVDDVSLSVAPGEIVSILGPNGAGKSSALLSIAGSVVPTRGSIEIAGIDLNADPLNARRHIGFADQPPSLYEFYTVAEHLTFIGRARGHDDPGQRETLLDALGLTGIRDRLCRELSFGMRQRVGLAAAMIGEIQVVLLDETLNGLDPRASVQARNVLTKACERGTAIVMSTHLLGVAERLCHRIIIMNAGKIVVDMAGAELARLLERGAGAIENLYLEHVTQDADA
jgi:ABC-type multidrug transport system ATPase subunit